MNSREIEDLLRKYYEGETSPEEEWQLSRFFNSDEVPPHLSVEADLFRGIAGNRSEELNDPDFDEKLLARIGDTPIVPIAVVRNRYYSIIGIAAGILLLAGLFFTFRSDILNNNAGKTHPDVVASYTQTRNVLMMVSANLNNGLDKVAAVSKFSVGIQNAQKVSTYFKYQSIFINPDEITRSQNH